MPMYTVFSFSILDHSVTAKMRWNLDLGLLFVYLLAYKAAFKNAPESLDLAFLRLSSWFWLVFTAQNLLQDTMVDNN